MLKLIKWDGSKCIETKQDAKLLLKMALEDGGEPEVIALTLRDIAKARGGVTKLARETGLTRMALYKILNGESAPSFVTLQKILKAFDLELTIK